MSKKLASSEEGDSLKEITTQLDKYLKEETTFRSTVETIKKLYKLSKQKGPESYSCFLCKSHIDENGLAGIEKNFLKKDNQAERNQ